MASLAFQTKLKADLFYRWPSGFEITAHRMFGHQPQEATYICIWDLAFGRLIGQLSPAGVQAIMYAGKTLTLNFSDHDNALPPDFALPVDPDATFLTLQLASIDVKLASNKVSTTGLIRLPSGLAVRSDDLASARYLKHMEIDVPLVELKCLIPSGTADMAWTEVASLRADASIVVGRSETAWVERAAVQSNFIRTQDEETGRCAFLYGELPRGVSSRTALGSIGTRADPACFRLSAARPVVYAYTSAFFEVAYVIILTGFNQVPNPP